MALKDLFRGRKAKGKPSPPTESYAVSDLIALGRLDDARRVLERRLKTNPRQHQVRLKLADLLIKQGRRAEAIDAYLEVTDGYASEGFYDKAHALLGKLSRLLPGEERIQMKLDRLELAQELDHRREVVSDAVVAAGKIKISSFTVQTLWRDIAKCSLVRELSETQLTKLFSQLAMEKLEENDRLVAAGEDRHEMFIVVQGEIAAQVLLASGKRTDLRTFSSGDIFGENALLKRKSWPSAYLAKRRTSLFRLDREGLENLLLGETDPRGLLDALRAQANDADVSRILSQLTGPGD